MEDYGIIRTIPGDDIGRASLTLPAPETAPAERMSAVVEAAHVGLVRIHYQRRLIGHHKSSHWAWRNASGERGTRNLRGVARRAG